MKNIYDIASNTFRETIRDRILYGILGFALLFILLDLFFAKLALGDMPMIKSFGLASIYLFGLLVTIFLGSSIIYKEIERRTLYLILSRPVSRSAVILGKFFGLFAAVTLTIFLMSLFYLGVISYEGGGFDRLGLAAILFQVLEMGVFTAMLVFFSAVVRPLTATVSAVVLLFAGHLLNAGFQNAGEIGGAAVKIFSVLYYLIPNLEKFNMRNLVVHQISPSSAMIWSAVGYAVIYIAILLYAAHIFFKKREL